jgi:hypothetical protein
MLISQGFVFKGTKEAVSKKLGEKQKSAGLLALNKKESALSSKSNDFDSFSSLNLNKIIDHGIPDEITPVKVEDDQYNDQ